MFKLIKELMNLRKSIEEKTKELNRLEKDINNRENIINNIKQNAQNEANIKSEEIINQGRQKLANIEEEISKKGKYINEVQEIKSEYEKISKKVSSQEKKLTKAKSIYNRIQYILEKFEEREITYISKEEFEVNESEYSEYPELNPTVQLKLNSMDLKELRKAFNENEKAIKQTLERYESRYTTKTNATIYKLMVIALKAEQQNILYNLKYDKLEKSIEDVKKLTDKYMKIAMDGNQSIVSTMRKFIGEIEYEYYVQKEKQREEQAKLREQMKQEAEEKKLLEQQKKQIEKEEGKYQTEIEKVEEIINSTEDEEKLNKLQEKIEELKNQLKLVNEKKEEITKLQNGKAGYVYVISNLGSFGDRVFKIGMTRRLNPIDRINELSGASVPFTFDVHSFIFSDNAVGLEQKMHEILNDNRVNKINLRKEFFKISIDELEKIVQDIDPSAEFNKTMIAEQYRQSLSIVN